MKTVFPYLLATCLLFPWCSVRLSAQQSPTATGEKKITITKRTVEADGTEVTETIVKKGEAAANFDTEKYVREHRSGRVQVEVRVEDGQATASRQGDQQEKKNKGWSKSSESNQSSAWTADEDDRAFLGVESDADEDASQPGIVVQVICNAAAAQAGLKTNDVLLRINDQPINRWNDLTAFMDQAKPGDKVRISYQRNNLAATAEAILGEEQGWDWKQWNADDSDWKDLDVEVKQKAACLGVYTEASMGDNDRSGASIISFTAESAAKEVQMLENDVITAVNGQRVQDHDDLWAEIAKYKSGDRVKVDFLRSGEKRTVEALLKPCQDNSQVTIGDVDADGDQQKRQFSTWNWNSDDQQQMRQNRLITIHKGGEGDAAQVTLPPADLPADRKLRLESFRAFSNPVQGPVTVEFRAAPVATVLSLLDGSGRQLFREELNMFGGEYKQQFDLSEYAKGTIIILVQQGDKSFSEQIVIN